MKPELAVALLVLATLGDMILIQTMGLVPWLIGTAFVGCALFARGVAR